MNDLSRHVLDLLENSLRAGATRIQVGLAVFTGADRLELLIEDNGPGIQGEPQCATDPFFTTKYEKKTGLGLSLFQAAVEAAGGAIRLGRSPLGGLRVSGSMRLSNVDRKPVGDMAASFFAVLLTHPEVELAFALDVDAKKSVVSTAGLAPSHRQSTGAGVEASVAWGFAEAARNAMGALDIDGALGQLRKE